MAGALFFAFAVMLMSTHGILGSAVTARNAPPELSKAVVVLSVFYLAVVVAMKRPSSAPTKKERLSFPNQPSSATFGR